VGGNYQHRQGRLPEKTLINQSLMGRADTAQDASNALQNRCSTAELTRLKQMDLAEPAPAAGGSSERVPGLPVYRTDHAFVYSKAVYSKASAEERPTGCRVYQADFTRFREADGAALPAPYLGIVGMAAISVLVRCHL